MNLTEFMEAAAEAAVAAASIKEELPMLILRIGDETVPVVVNPKGAGQELAQAVRLVLLAMEPSLAVLSMEGWGMRESVPANDPDRRRLALGEVSPSQLPPDKRSEILWLHSEAAATGERISRVWEIQVDAEGKRTGLIEMTKLYGKQVHSRFHPMFIAEEIIRALTATDPPEGISPEMEEVRKEVASLKIPPYEMRALAKKIAARILSTGGGGTSREWEVSRERLYKLARKQQP